MPKRPPPSRELPSQELIEQIRSIERGGVFAQDHANARMATGWLPIDQQFGGATTEDTETHAELNETDTLPNTGGLQRGTIHEWFGVAEPSPDTGDNIPGETDDQPAPPRRVSHHDWAPPLCLLIHLAWQAITEETRRHQRVVWIGRKCWPYGRSLVRPGEQGQRLLEQSVFVDTDNTHAIRHPMRRLARHTTRSRINQTAWAVDLALRNPAVSAVIADASGFDTATTRRLQLAAESNTSGSHGHDGTIALLARPPDERHLLSVAATRWWVQPQVNPPIGSFSQNTSKGAEQGQGSLASNSLTHGNLTPSNTRHLMQRWNAAALAQTIAQIGKPPQPRWRLTLLRCKGTGLNPGQSSLASNITENQWTLEWSDETRSIVVPANMVDRPDRAARRTA